MSNKDIFARRNILRQKFLRRAENNPRRFNVLRRLNALEKRCEEIVKQESIDKDTNV